MIALLVGKFLVLFHLIDNIPSLPIDNIAMRVLNNGIDIYEYSILKCDVNTIVPLSCNYPSVGGAITNHGTNNHIDIRDGATNIQLVCYMKNMMMSSYTSYFPNMESLHRRSA